MISFCNLIGGALAEPPEVNGLNPSMLPGSFLPRAERGNEPGDEANTDPDGSVNQHLTHIKKCGPGIF